MSESPAGPQTISEPERTSSADTRDTQQTVASAPATRLGINRFECQGVGMNVSATPAGSIFIGQRCAQADRAVVDEYRRGPCGYGPQDCFDAVLIIGTPPPDFVQLPEDETVLVLGGEASPALVLRKTAACYLGKTLGTETLLSCEFQRGQLLSDLAKALPAGTRLADAAPIRLLLPHPADRTVTRAISLDMDFPDGVHELHAALEREMRFQRQVEQCDGGAERTCESLRGRDDPRAQAAGKAGLLKLREKECLDGNHAKCAVAAALVAAAEQHSERRQRLLKLACDKGDEESCVDLAEAMDTGGVEPAILRRIMQLMETACAKGIVRACRSLGVRYRDGLQVSRDAVKARNWLVKACRLGNQESCAEVHQRR
jgi:hypothetical protein